MQQHWGERNSGGERVTWRGEGGEREGENEMVEGGVGMEGEGRGRGRGRKTER